MFNIYNEYNKRYTEIAGSRSLFNEKMNSAMLMAAIGAAINKREILIQTQTLIDMRIHELIVQGSRTGKGVSMNCLDDLAGYLGLTMAQELQFTDAGIVGKIDNNAIKTNKKGGFLPGDPEYVNPMVIGDLGLYDIVAFTEAKQMIKTGTHTEDKLEILQTIMDVPQPGKPNVRKKLSDEMAVEYTSNATIIGTTYFLQEFEEILLKQGLFQRLYTVVRDVSWMERERINDAMIFPPKGLLSPSEYSPAMEELASQINSSINSYSKGTRIELNESGRRGLRTLNKERMNYIKRNISGTELEIIEPFLTAMVPMNIKLGGLRAICNGSDDIGMKEISGTRTDMMSYLESIVNNVMTRISGINLDAMKRLVMSFLKARGSAKRSDVVSLLTEKTFTSEKRCDVIVSGLLKNKSLIEEAGVLRINK
ncbi:MAG: hypothetical protein Q8M92_05405 [Candidatus Subteraquimicrobiales bacterium]|nr:hypothetical protein [Candidatus Subteraquimicrobiales bacterium]